jgi:mannose/fructose/N-acetylgalactosamine-specific phosphotransferase system component IIC
MHLFETQVGCKAFIVIVTGIALKVSILVVSYATPYYLVGFTLRACVDSYRFYYNLALNFLS